MKVELKQIIDELTDAINLPKGQKVAAVIDIDKIVCWTIVDVHEDGSIKPISDKKFNNLKELIEKYHEQNKKAVEIKDKIFSLRKNLEDLKGGYWDKTKIELKTGYSDMGMDIIRSTVFDEEIGYKIRDFITDIISNKIAELEKEFENLQL